MLFLAVTPAVLDVNAIVTNVVLTLVGVAITAVAGFASAFLHSKLNANQLGLLEDITSSVVLAVEQSTYGSELANDAIAKKGMAMDAASALLEKYGVHVTGEQLSTAIESAVGNVLNAGKLVDNGTTPPSTTTETGATDEQGFVL